MKFICEGCEKPCILEVGDCYNLTADVLQCVCKNNCYCKWEEFKEEPTTTSSQSATNCNRLPKLTAEVFDRPDCPEWAKWAAVDKDGKGFYYKNKPKKKENKKWSLFGVDDYQHIGIFDASGWHNSLVERPAKLPDWCKVGEWVYYRGYRKIIEVKALRLVLESAHCGNLTVYPEEIGKEVKQSRFRPYNAEEMKALLGKVIERYSSAYLVISYAHDDLETTVYIEGKYLSADNLLRDFTINGEPCGVLEHFEEGEWVK